MGILQLGGGGKAGVGRLPVFGWRLVWQGWAAGQSGEGGPAAWRLIYSAMGFWRMAFSLLGAVMVSIGKGGWAAGQSGEGGPAALRRLVYSAIGFGALAFSFCSVR